MKDAELRITSETKLRQVADEAFQKLVSMDDKAFNEFIDAHIDGDIAQLLLYGNAFSIETASCCQFNEPISSWKFALSVNPEQMIAGTVTMQGTVSGQISTQHVFRYGSVGDNREEYLWAA